MSRASQWCVRIAAACVVGSAAGAEAPRPFDAIAHDYLRLAFESNLALRSAGLELERSREALAAARARFYPELALNARYTLADGGREITFPVGQLLNPAYQTLNDLLVAQGQPPRFTSLVDQSFAFQREREQDTRVTLRQPLYQPAIPAAVTAQRALLEGAQFARLALARQLQRDVVVTYVSYLKAMRAAQIVRSGGELLQENLRVNDSLFRNGRITQDQVLRARAELLASDQQLRETEDSATQARSLLNFLLNRSLDTPLEEALELTDEPDTVTGSLAELRSQSLLARPELKRLDSLGEAARAQLRGARAALKPSLSLGIDAGTQGEDYRLGPGYNFIAGSLVLTWKFFDGGANRAEAAQARIAARTTELQRDELALRVQLEVQQAVDRLQTAADSLSTARARDEAARAAFRIASSKRDAGTINQVEFIDARNALTGAELNLNLTRFSLLDRGAELQYAAGSGELPPLPPVDEGRSP